MATGVSTLPELKFRPETKIAVPRDKARFYHFVVVNKPLEDQYFEDMPPLVMDPQGAAIPNHYRTNMKEITFREIIPSRHYRITYSYCDEGEHPEVVALSAPKTYKAKKFTAEEVSPAAYALQEAGLDMVYCNHHTLAIRGGTKNTYELEDGTVISSDMHFDNGIDSFKTLYNNVTILPMTRRITQTTYDGFVHVCFIPNDMSNKFDLEKEDMAKYKFEMFQMKAGEEVMTPVFDGAMYSFLHTSLGNFKVEGYEIPYQHNYEYDANESIKITCLEDGIINVLAHVPSLDRSLFE